MTRAKKKSSLPKPSVVQAAWEAFYKESEVESLDALNAQGWKTIDQMVEESGRTRNSLDSAIRNSPNFERHPTRVRGLDGVVRRMNLVRPKLKG